MRGIITQVFLQIFAFSLQSVGSGPPILSKGKRPETIKRENTTLKSKNLKKRFSRNFSFGKRKGRCAEFDCLSVLSNLL